MPHLQRAQCIHGPAQVTQHASGYLLHQPHEGRLANARRDGLLRLSDFPQGNSALSKSARGRGVEVPWCPARTDPTAQVLDGLVSACHAVS